MSAPLILVPGLVSDATVWTGMPAGEVLLSDADSIDGMAADILARAPPRFALAGHSMGGYVALAMIAQAPARIERLALLSSSAAPDRDDQRTARRATMAAARRDYPATIEPVLHALLHADARNDAGLIAEQRAMMLHAGRETFLRQQTATLDRTDRRAILPEIAVPTLLLHGADDRIVAPERSREMAAAIPGARLVIMPRCGHVPQREKPTATYAAMAAWLADTLD